MLALKSACLRFLQNVKAPSSIRFSDAGTVKDLSPERANAYDPRVSSPSLGLTDYNILFQSNACGWTSVTVRGNVYVLARFSEIILLASLLTQASLITRI